MHNIRMIFVYTFTLHIYYMYYDLWFLSKILYKSLNIFFTVSEIVYCEIFIIIYYISLFNIYIIINISILWTK